MLAQDKESLKATLATQALQIRERELNLFHDSLNSVGTQAALFAGFAFAAMVEFEIPEDTHQGWVAAFMLLAVSTLVLNMNCVVHSISVGVWGPGLALRGTTADAMLRAVNGMRDERLLAFQVGFVGTIGIQLSACAMAAIALEAPLAVAVSMVLVASCAYSVHTIVRVRSMFAGEHDVFGRTLYDISAEARTFDEGLLSAPDIRASPAWCCGGSSRHRPMSPAHSPSKNSQRLSFDQVEIPDASSFGPPLATHSGYLQTSSGSMGGVDRKFFVLFESELFPYPNRSAWNSRQKPAPPVALQELVLVPSPPAPTAPRHAILAAVRKQVTGDGDVSIRSFLAGQKPEAPGATVGTYTTSAHVGTPNEANGASLRFQLTRASKVVVLDLIAEDMVSKAAWLSALRSVVESVSDGGSAEADAAEGAGLGAGVGEGMKIEPVTENP